VALTRYEPKRLATLAAHGLDFADADTVIEGRVFEFPDNRTDYGERRTTTAGYLGDRMIIIVWTDRPPNRHIISMRKANARERRRYAVRLD
jgi:uncharacterized DUF497 family protein